MEIKKHGGRITPEQENFIRVVRENGGIAGVVYMPEDVRKLLTTA
jgi:hypothetical protein